MDEVSPRRFPTSLSQELRLTEENEPLNSFLFQSPSKSQKNVEPHERQDSASPSLSPSRARTHDRFSDNVDFKDLLFTFPRLYSDLASERDPFFDCRGMPLNPNNTPISQSGRQSETGSWRKDKQTVPSPVKSGRQTPQTSDARSDDNPLASLFIDRETAWRPPKPPKPLFLSGADLFDRSKVENARPPIRIKPSKRGDGRRNPPDNPYRSLPIRPSWNLTQPSLPEQVPGRPKQSWQSRSIVPCRYFPRPFTDQELEILGIPLNKGIPFPAPIPTMDKLPLRRGIIKFDNDGAGQCLIDTGVSKMEPPKPTAGEIPNPIWRLSQQFTKTAIRYLSPSKRAASKADSSVRTTITIPFASKCEACAVEPEQAAALSSADGAYVLQVSIAYPLLFAQRSTLFAATMRSFLSSRIAVTTAFLVQFFVMGIVRWLLSVFQIEVAVEVRRI